MAKSTTYLASKPRYEILDGLRGVAAMMVVAFHLFESYSRGAAFQIINHGYLAVDFFFVLSGFVIGYAYDDRWDRMTTWGFFKRRITRLHPMVIAGTVIGLLMFYWGIDAFRLIGTAPAWKIAVCFIMGCLMLPVKPAMDIRGWSETYPLNGPQWTLMLEYIANILYALIFRRLPKWALAICVGLFAVLTLDLTLGWNIFGLLGRYQGRVIGGWSITPDQLYIGFCRLLYPFFCGLLISRIGKFIKVRGGFWWCALVLAALLAMPRVGAAPSFSIAADGTRQFLQGGVKFNGMYEAFVILCIFPLLVMTGAGSTISGKSQKICQFLGNVSYPLYITHYPLIYFQMSWLRRHPILDPTAAEPVAGAVSLGVHIAFCVCIFLLAIGIAWALFKLYDEPVREWLKDHWLKRKVSNSQPITN